MSSDAHYARIGGRLAEGSRRGPRSRSVQSCVTARRDASRPVVRRRRRSAGAGRAVDPLASVVTVPVTRVTTAAGTHAVVVSPAPGPRDHRVRLTRRGRIVLTCGWTMIAALVLWAAVLFTG